MGVEKVERFYKFVLLPRVREDIRKNKRLHFTLYFTLYQSLKKALYKPAAFSKGIAFPLCESRTCTLTEAVILGSIIEKCCIIEAYRDGILWYNKCSMSFLQKLPDLALPYRVIDALVAHFMKFYDESRVMPVIWHQSLLAFA